MPADGPGAAFALFPLLCLLVFFVLAAVATGFWIWMLIECLTKESSQSNDKLVWAAVIFFLNGLGAILYYFVRRPQRIRDLGQ